MAFIYNTSWMDGFAVAVAHCVGILKPLTDWGQVFGPQFKTSRVGTQNLILKLKKKYPIVQDEGINNAADAKLMSEQFKRGIND